MFHKHTYPLWSHKIFLLVASLIMFEFVGGLYLYLDNRHNVFHQYSLLFHILLGFSLIIPFAIYIFKHFYDVVDERKARGEIVGIISFVIVTLSCVTGTYQAFVGFEKGSYWMSYIHTWTGFAGMIMVVAHIITTQLKYRRESSSFGDVACIRPVSTFDSKNEFIKISGSCISLFLIITLLTITYRDIEYKNGRAESYTMKYGDNPFLPSEAMTASGDVIDARVIGNSRSCSSVGCHEDIYKQWYSSAHRYSSTDVFYRKAEQYFVETEGKEATRYCAGCHDPVALLSGSINQGEDYDTLHSDEGSSCIVCHAITSVRHLKGSGSYLLMPPERYIFEGRAGWFFEYINNLLIKTAPKMHKEEYAKDFYNTPEYCAVCHKQYIKDPNEWGWVKLQDQYGEWLSSHYSGRNDKGFNRDNVKLCRDCHMPLVDSDDPSSGPDGKVRSHRFIAANTAIPWLDGDMEQFELTKDWLKGRKILITIFEPRDKNASKNMAFVDNDIYRLSEPAPYVTMGQEVDLKVMLTNAGAGHGFPNGPLDIYESWLEVKVVDGQNSVIFWSGKVSEDDYVEKENTRFFFTLGVDRKGRLVDKHNLWHMIGNAYKKKIMPGSTDLSSYKFVVPYWVKGDITVMARLRYRRFNKWFTDWVFANKDVRLPIIDMARATVSIPVRMRPDQEAVGNPLVGSFHRQDAKGAKCEKAYSHKDLPDNVVRAGTEITKSRK